MTENEAIVRMRNRIDTATDIVGKGSDGKAYEDMEIAIKALKEIQQYWAIGTVKECWEARERQRGKKPIILSEQSAESEGKLYIAKYFKCPTCGNTSTYFGGLPNNCHNCGQSLESDIPCPTK